VTIRHRTLALLACAALVIPAGPVTAAEPRPAAGPLPPGTEIRGWNILSNNDAGADLTIAASRAYGINQIHLSHQLVHHLREIKDPARAKRVNRLTDAAHAAGASEVVVWDHSLYKLDYYPSRFRTGPNGTIDLDNPAFWTWFKQDYRTMLNLVPRIDAVALTFIETGARVEGQYSKKLKTAEEKLAYLVDRIAEVIVDERGLNLYLRTFGYYPAEMERTIGAIALVKNDRVRVMAKSMPHDYHLTHPNDLYVQRINRPTLIEYDAAGEFNGQGKIAGAWPQDHLARWKYYETLPNVIGYVARTDRYDASHIVGTPTEINLYALARAVQQPTITPEEIYADWTRSTYGAAAAPRVASALGKSFEIVTSSLYSLGTNTANHSMLDYEPYCSSYHRHVSGKWLDPPEVTVAHTVDRRFHYWIDIIDRLSPIACKTDGILRREAPDVLDKGWVKSGNRMDLEYLGYLVKEKDHGVRVTESALADIEAARPDLTAAHYRQLRAYFERTLLTARLHRAVAKAYFGYRVYARGSSHRTPELTRTIQDGLREAKQVAAAIRAYPDKATSGEWNWLVDAAEADKYYARITKGWDRYGGVKVPPPA